MKRLRDSSRDGDLPFLQAPVRVSGDDQRDNDQASRDRDEDKESSQEMDARLVSATLALLGLPKTQRLSLFPVQRAAWREWHRANSGEAHDLCIASPTGA